MEHMEKQPPVQEEESSTPVEEKVTDLHEEEVTPSADAQPAKIKWWVALAGNRSFLIALSVFISVVLWVAISMNTYVEETITIYDVPVTYTLPASASNLGLSIVEKSVEKVDVQITGNRYIVGQIKTGSLQANVQPSSISRAGTYTIPIEVESISDSLSNFEVTKLSSAYADVRLDRVVEKEFSLEYAILNPYSADTGLELGEPLLEDRTILVYGPQTDLARISRVVAEATVEEVIGATATYDASIVLYDSYGNKIAYATEENPKSPINLEFASTGLTLIAYKEVTLPVVVTPLNAPAVAYMPKMTYTPSQLQVLVPVDMLSSLKEIHVGTVDFSALQAGDEVTFDFSLEKCIPDGCTLRDAVQNVQVRMDLRNMTTRTFTVENFALTNAGNTRATVSTKSLSVSLSGPQNAINNLTPDQISAVIDLKAISGKGSQEVPVQISLKTTDACWVYGTPKAWVNIPE